MHDDERGYMPTIDDLYAPPSEWTNAPLWEVSDGAFRLAYYLSQITQREVHEDVRHPVTGRPVRIYRGQVLAPSTHLARVLKRACNTIRRSIRELMSAGFLERTEDNIIYIVNDNIGRGPSIDAAWVAHDMSRAGRN